ncbi:Uncharacterised protein [Kluyvera cryocrescens]|uniref:Uncharacterized protein n=1 Tax=Kluyvera cryocrescens TaxID=580 RepID=A0A485AB99_KLUCR|nr:Uncharacterised protein [Kluyvera cryocrescens]
MRNQRGRLITWGAVFYAYPASADAPCGNGKIKLILNQDHACVLHCDERGLRIEQIFGQNKTAQRTLKHGGNHGDDA